MSDRLAELTRWDAAPAIGVLLLLSGVLLSVGRWAWRRDDAAEVYAERAQRDNGSAS